MRLFQIKINPVDTMDWIVGNEKYEAEYGERRKASLAEAVTQAENLAKFGITLAKDHPTIINDKQMLDLTVAKVGFDLVREIEIDEDSPSDLNGVMRKFNRLAQRLISLPGLTKGGESHANYNEKCEVHMPGQALSIYNEVLLLEDICTDELQRSLNLGWRIIAACPQPNNRRPDYVLGRFNDKINTLEHSAARSPE